MGGAVLTYEEYESKLKEPSHKNTKPREPKKVPSASISKQVKKNEIIYTFLHPELPQNGSISYVDEINIDGIKYKRVCVDGVLRTGEKVLADFLVRKGYILLNQEEINNV